MTCPKCNEGTIVRIRFKKTGKMAYLCDFCETVWFEGEDINFNTGHAFESYTGGHGLEYTIDEIHEKDQDHQPVDYTDYR